MPDVVRIRARLQMLPGWVTDLCLSLLILAVDLCFHRFVIVPETAAPPWAVIVGLVLGTVPLTFRRRAPLVVLAVLAVTAVTAAQVQVNVSELGLCVAFYTVGARCARRESVSALGLFTIAKSVAEMGNDVGRTALLRLLLFAYAAAWFVGDQRRVQRGMTRELARRARKIEGEREQRIRMATAAERARIARDLHDVVAHSVSVMVLHTAAARRTLKVDPKRAEDSFAQVEATGRQCLTELRQLLGLLRDGGGDAELTPQPRLAYLDELVERFRDAGLAVLLKVEGESRPLSAVADLSAYRIVQEALTNSLKHAEADKVDVRIRYRAHELEIEVVDDGRARPVAEKRDGEQGHGLVGMHERAVLVGGWMHAQHRPEGGFRVTAVIPLEATS